MLAHSRLICAEKAGQAAVVPADAEVWPGQPNAGRAKSWPEHRHVSNGSNVPFQFVRNSPRSWFDQVRLGPGGQPAKFILSRSG